MRAPIETARLRLECLGPAVLRALLAHDYARASLLLGAHVPLEMATLDEVFALRLSQLREAPGHEPWLTRAMVHAADRVVVGVAGFHGPPGRAWLEDVAPGAAEFGYTVLERYRRRGYALEAGAALVQWGLEHGADRFVLSIGPENAASLRLAEKLGFERAGQWMHETRGLEYVYVRDERR
jgi:RimJ/RimL family protein N-acetyltransferase